mmetsp:Transcript_75134/g.122105  ORF Transcript_75134/g.122105 Transcript_75134/m.122105 type:complete len:208 (-) Transcript_75134:76-699(-)
MGERCRAAQAPSQATHGGGGANGQRVTPNERTLAHVEKQRRDWRAARRGQEEGGEEGQKGGEEDGGEEDPGRDDRRGQAAVAAQVQAGHSCRQGSQGQRVRRCRRQNGKTNQESDITRSNLHDGLQGRGAARQRNSRRQNPRTQCGSQERTCARAATARRPQIQCGGGWWRSITLKILHALGHSAASCGGVARLVNGRGAQRGAADA